MLILESIGQKHRLTADIRLAYARPNLSLRSELRMSTNRYAKLKRYRNNQRMNSKIIITFCQLLFTGFVSFFDMAFFR